MVSKLFNGFKLIIGGSFTILGGLVFFFTGNLLNVLVTTIEKTNNPNVSGDLLLEMTAFKQAHNYSIILIIIGFIISLHAIMKLFQADFEKAQEKTHF